MSTATKDSGNILRSVYNTNESLNVTITGSGSPTLPNVVELSNGTDFITTTTEGSKIALDVAIQNIPEILISDIDDSIKIGDGTGTYMAVNSDRSINSRNLNSIVPVPFDSIYPTYPSGVVEVYTYKSSAVTVATVTVTYVDSTKNDIISIVRT